MFMLMIWFQGIWLPQHGYAFSDTPLWAGIYMIPFTLGFVVAGPISGMLSDRYGARPFATGGMLLAAATYALMMTFPANFSYWPFGAVMFVSGISGGLFASPNTSSIMNSVPARHRGAASGMRVTFASTGMPLSMGLFFTLLVAGLNAKVPAAMLKGLVANGVQAHAAAALAHVPPLGYVFAAFLGYNPLKTLLGPSVLSHLSAAQAAHLTSRAFFPQLIGPAFVSSLGIILTVAVVMSLVAAIASAFRGAKFVHVDEESAAQRHVARGGRHHAPVASDPALAVGSAPAASSGAAPAASGSTTAASSALPAEPHPVPGK
jgi:MFS family permease